MPSPYWQNQMAPLNRGLANIAQIPLLRMQVQQQAAQRAAQAGELNARTQLLGSQSKVEDLKAQELSGSIMNDGTLAKALKRVALNPQDTDAQGDVIAAFGSAYKKDPDGTSKALGNLFAQFQARNGSTNFPQMGALQGGATSIANNIADNQEKAARPVNVTGMLTSPTGDILATAPKTVPQGSILVGQPGTPQMQTIATGVAPSPKSSATQENRSRFIAKIIATPDSEMDAKTKRSVIATYDAQTGFNQPDKSTPNAPAAQPATTNTPATSQFQSAEDVRSAYKAGKLDRATAIKVLQSQFGQQ